MVAKGAGRRLGLLFGIRRVRFPGVRTTSRVVSTRSWNMAVVRRSAAFRGYVMGGSTVYSSYAKQPLQCNCAEGLALQCFSLYPINE